MRKGTKPLCREPFFFLILLHFLPQGPLDAYLSEGPGDRKQKPKEAKELSFPANYCYLQTECESECTGKVGLFINVQFACYAIHHKPAKHDFPALLAIAAAEKSAGLDVPAIPWQSARETCPLKIEYFP